MDVLAEKMIESLTQWNIETKMSTITVDNCSSNDGMIRLVQEKLSNELLLQGKFLHMRCCAHILNLIVKDGLFVIEGSIETIRDSVSFWSASPSRMEKFEDVARQLKISCTKKLALDCKTRWNSTNLMLQTALEYKDVFPRLKLREKAYCTLPT
ncbi:zinc finger BED domain-containing protein RICESLEEPER 1-like [Canna indica]|uniref:Zinc finger BED domain-containing protein RICESLEEPER 1-like n=1 Tax=Canna indica TaxID=4628 RepID=A0AAQ3QH36_9LILI|nr:zinc finger BED domain-containing protein RICESLEEPER 1-like [Canna indica]